ncbi:hypothetical protein LINPERPRIM_LOCUS11932 [Linum perenne]
MRFRRSLPMKDTGRRWRASPSTD